MKFGKMLTDADYQNIVEHAEEGRIQEAMELLDELFPEEGGMDSGEVWGHGPNRAAAMSRAGQRLRQITSNLGSREFHEAMSRYLPEGRPAPWFAHGEHWDKVATPERIAEHIEACAQSVQEHRGVTDKLGTTAPSRPEAAGFVVPVQDPVVEPGQVGVPTEAAVHLDKRRRRKKKQVPEGNVPGSAAVDTDLYVAAATFQDGRTMQGFLMKREGSSIWFVTGRHKIEGEGAKAVVVDGFTCALGYSIVLHRPGREDVSVTVVDHRGTGDDRVCLRLEGNVGPVGAPRFSTPNKGSVGTAVMAKVFTPDRRWMALVGTIQGVYANAVAYNVSTAAGYCRAAFFDRGGAICAGHFFPGGMAGVGNFPGGHFESGVVPKVWETAYTVPDLVPQGGKVEMRGPFQRVEKFKLQRLSQIEQCREAAREMTGGRRAGGPGS